MKWTEAVDAQAESLRRILKAVRCSDTDRFLDMLVSSHKVFLVGRGRTGYIVGTFAMRLMHLGLDVHVVGDCTTPRISQDDLLVAISGSGRTRTVIQMAQIARRARARVAFITYNESAPCPAERDLTVLIPALIDRDRPLSNEPVFQPLGTTFEESLMLYLDLVTWKLMERVSISESDMAQRHTNLE